MENIHDDLDANVVVDLNAGVDANAVVDTNAGMDSRGSQRINGAPTFPNYRQPLEPQQPSAAAIHRSRSSSSTQIWVGTAKFRIEPFLGNRGTLGDRNLEQRCRE